MEFDFSDIGARPSRSRRGMALMIGIAYFKVLRKIRLDAFTSNEMAIHVYEKCKF